MKRVSSGERLASALNGMINKMDARGRGEALIQARVRAAFMHVAGERVAGHTTGSFLREGELVVYVDSPVWATELNALSSRYQEEINKELGVVRVSSMRFVVSRKVAEERDIERREDERHEFYGQGKVPSIPLSEIERAQLKESVKVIPDPELREAVLRASIADLEWKKGIQAAKRREKP